MMRLLAAVLWVLPVAGFAVQEGLQLDPVKIDLADKGSLQHGARTFINYCLSCHSAAYMRYNRMGQDLGISDELVKENLLFAAERVGDLMKAVMPEEDARLWFGTAPPDLSLVTRYRGADWVYTYLRSFYREEDSPSGWNNVVFENVAMPHVLYEWQGSQKPVFRTDANGLRVFDRFEAVKPGTKTMEEFDREMRDLTNFLVYMGEPAKLVRYRIGVYVLLFLAVLLGLFYALKREYWKDVH